MERLALEAQQKLLESPTESEINLDKFPSGRQKKFNKSHGPGNLNSSNEKEDKKGKKKGQKLYCICRTPYDKSKLVHLFIYLKSCKTNTGFIFFKRFYIGCDLCNNWFHGECVGITEDQSKDMTDFTCTECDRAKNNQELFCLCRTPYDQSQYVNLKILY